MIKLCIWLWVVFYAGLSYAENKPILIGGESFTFIGESVLNITDFGTVINKNYKSQTNQLVSIYALPRKYYLRYTGRYFAYYLSQQGYKITDWYSQGNFFVLNVTKPSIDSKLQNGIVIFDLLTDDAILAMLYLKPLDSSKYTMDWNRTNIAQINLLKQIKASLGAPPASKTTFVRIKPLAHKMSFMGKNYQLKDSRPMLSPGFQYEFLPIDQDFGLWHNLITMQIMPPLMTPDVFAKSLHMSAKQRKFSIFPDNPIVVGKSGAIYVTYYLVARAALGTGNVYINTKNPSVNSIRATANLAETKEDLILELNVNKVYQDKSADSNLVNLIYAERRYGKVSESQFAKLEAQIPFIIKSLESLQVNSESAPRVKVK